MNIKKHIPNAITCCNLLCGCLAIVQAFEGNLVWAAYLVGIAAVLDFFDGFVARALKSNSNLGAQLDSLADMVSFGVAPGLIMFNLLEPFGSSFLGLNLPFEIKYLGLLITVFSCLRLAIFNLDEEQTYYFKGLNTPSNTVLIFGISYILLEKLSPKIFEMEIYQIGLILLTFLSSWLLISPIKMIAMIATVLYSAKIAKANKAIVNTVSPMSIMLRL